MTPKANENSIVAKLKKLKTPKERANFKAEEIKKKAKLGKFTYNG